MSDNLEGRRMDRLGWRSVDWIDGAVVIVDQTRLPGSLEELRIEDVPSLVSAIKRLSVRGAPALGVAGAFGVAMAVRDNPGDREALDTALGSLRHARPTAVNLSRMVDRVAAHISQGFERVLAEACAVRDEEVAASQAMGELGAELIAELLGPDPVAAMTICNTGGLATVERGTALAVIQTLHEGGRLREALALETRPLLQGARLTTWELSRIGATHRLLVDSAGPFLLSRGAADVVLTGADRIAANGDVANKIGTYALALAAARSGVPFVVVAPETTVDLSTASGADVAIEDRGSGEVVSFAGVATAPSGTEAVNPAFDVTPFDLITAIVTDRRVIRLDKGETLESVPPVPARDDESDTTERKYR